MNDAHTELGRQARRWLTGTLHWEAQLQTLRIRADLALAGGDLPELASSPDQVVAVTSRSRPELTGWDEHLDRTA